MHKVIMIALYNPFKAANKVCTIRTRAKWSDRASDYKDCKSHTNLYFKYKYQRFKRYYICRRHIRYMNNYNMSPLHIIGHVPPRIFMDAVAGKIKIKKVSR